MSPSGMPSKSVSKSSREPVATPQRPTSPSLRVVGVQTEQGRHVEATRQAGLAVVDQEPVPRVRLRRRAVAGELAHRPEPAAVHRRVGAARERVGAGLTELASGPSRRGRRARPRPARALPRGSGASARSRASARASRLRGYGRRARSTQRSAYPRPRGAGRSPTGSAFPFSSTAPSGLHDRPVAELAPRDGADHDPGRRDRLQPRRHVRRVSDRAERPLRLRADASDHRRAGVQTDPEPRPLLPDRRRSSARSWTATAARAARIAWSGSSPERVEDREQTVAGEPLDHAALAVGDLGTTADQ